MSRYVFKRLLSFIPMMLLITFISFLIMDLSPVDPVTMYLKPGQEAITQERIEEVRHELGLDQPLVIRYVYWLKEAVQGNLGYSLSTKKPVLTEISSRIGTTVLVQLLTLVVSAVGGIMLGVYSARHRYSFQDTSITVLTFMGISKLLSCAADDTAVYDEAGLAAFGGAEHRGTGGPHMAGGFLGSCQTPYNACCGLFDGTDNGLDAQPEKHVSRRCQSGLHQDGAGQGSG